jgi:hypothetical protein
MPFLAMQKFIERIDNDPRPLKTSVYAEIGQLIEKLCNADQGRRVTYPVQQRLVALLKTEFVSSQSSIESYATCTALLANIYGKKLISDTCFAALAIDLLNAAATQMSLYHRGDFLRSVDESLCEPEYKRCDELLNNVMRIYMYGDPKLNRSGRLTMRGFLDAAYPPKPEKGQPPLTVVPLFRKSADTPPEGYVGLVDHLGEVAGLMRTVRWTGLSAKDDEKNNCKELVGLLELVAGEIDDPAFAWLDALNARAEIFEEPVVPPTPFFDEEF